MKLCWVVMWVVPFDDDVRDAITGRGIGNCGHEHVTADEAFACPWEPSPLPPIGAGLVREIRADDGRRRRGAAQIKMPWAERPLRQRRRSAA